MLELNLNQNVTIYPTQRGWDIIKSIVSDFDEFDSDDVEVWIKERTMKDGGFKEQLHYLITHFTGLFGVSKNKYLVSSKMNVFPLL